VTGYDAKGKLNGGYRGQGRGRSLLAEHKATNVSSRSVRRQRPMSDAYISGKYVNLLRGEHGDAGTTRSD